MKIIYMGTPDFAVAPLLALLQAGHEVLAVVTQPDKPKGRGREVQMTPVKECALAHGIPVLQPVKVKAPEEVARLREYQAELFVIAAFGQFLSEEILTMPKYGCINIHASLLPAYRGAAPIQWAILKGEKKSGVTIMQMEKGIDTGDMLLKKEVEITPSETGESLHDKLMEAGAELIVTALSLLEKGEIRPCRQQEELATYAPKITREMGEIDFEKSAEEVDRLIRGLAGWPCAYTFYKGKMLKIWQARLVRKDELLAEHKATETIAKAPAGTVLAVEKDAFLLACGQGDWVLRILSLQLEGKKRMDVKDFLRGYEIREGMRFPDQG